MWSIVQTAGAGLNHFPNNTVAGNASLIVFTWQTGFATGVVFSDDAAGSSATSVLVDPANVGLNYQVGDALSYAPFSMSFQVTSVSGGGTGAVTGLSITNGGSGATNNAGGLPLTGGHGTGVNVYVGTGNVYVPGSQATTTFPQPITEFANIFYSLNAKVCKFVTPLGPVTPNPVYMLEVSGLLGFLVSASTNNPAATLNPVGESLSLQPASFMLTALDAYDLETFKSFNSEVFTKQQGAAGTFYIYNLTSKDAPASTYQVQMTMTGTAGTYLSTSAAFLSGVVGPGAHYVLNEFDMAVY